MSQIEHNVPSYQPDESLSAELLRVKRAYAKRSDKFLYSFFSSAQRLAIHEREQELLYLLARRGCTSLNDKKILEIGCGNGTWLLEFLRWGARPQNIWGVDLLQERIDQARQICPAEITLKCQDATSLDAPDGSFDFILQSTVFTSILDLNMKRKIAKEMLRVLSPAGMIIWYDFRVNNPRNTDVRGVGKREILELFPNYRIQLKKLTLAPPVGRSVANISIPLYRFLSAIKPLCTHYLGLISRL